MFPDDCDPEYDYDFTVTTADLHMVDQHPCWRCGGEAHIVARGWGPVRWSKLTTTNDVAWMWSCRSCWEEWHMERIL